MNAATANDFRKERVILGVLGLGLGLSVVVTCIAAVSRSQADEHGAVAPAEAVPLDFQILESCSERVMNPLQSDPAQRDLFTGDFRVIAIGSAYPIPYDATVCPYSGVPQPALNQLDRDSDGMTDDWEQKHGLNKYSTADASLDPDGDGFSNLEEFRNTSDPGDAASHPPYATKLRFVERKDIPFFLVFQGFTELEDGRIVFQLNNSTTGRSHFLSLGEAVEEVTLQRFEPAESGRSARLFVVREKDEIELVRGEIALDPKSKAELIYILDQTPVLVTMGALLSLRNDEYTVLEVHPDKAILKDIRTGNVFEIVGLADGKQ